MPDAIQIAPSILASDFARLGEEVQRVEEGGADFVHVDVMDGHFVPNITMGPIVVEALRPRTDLPLDVHLMIEQPGRYVEAFAAAGADYLTVHVEACPHLHRVVQQIREHGVKAGVALNPHTPLAAIEAVLHDLNLVLIMSVNPGFGGQAFIPHTLERLRRLRALLRERGLDGQVAVEVDGGIKAENARSVVEAGAQVLVSGSGIYGADDPAEAVRALRRAAMPEPEST